MSYRNGTYIAFHAGGTTNPTASDIKYYNALQAWNANKKFDFQFVNSHDKTSAVRDSSSRETLRRAIVTRLNNSKNMVLILTETTKNDTDWVPFEIEQAIDKCKITIIAAYPGATRITEPRLFEHLWPAPLASRIYSGLARVIHIPFRQEPLMDAIEYMTVARTDYPKNGYGYYTPETYTSWGL